MSSTTQLLMTRSKSVATSTKLAGNKQEVIVDQQQSLELVQILLSATVSSIMYLRNVFPDSCYEARLFNNSDPKITYKDFTEKEIDAADLLQMRDLIKRGMSQWQILARGRDKQADKLLDWIDLGVADALKKKYLSSAQLAFFDGKVCPENAIEIYTIFFSYQKVGGARMEVQHKSENHGMTFKVAKDNLRGTMTRLIKIVQGLDDLPRHRTVSMQLAYNESCPADYQPPGFIACSDPKLLLDEKEGIPMGTLDTNHHKVDLRYSVKSGQDFPVVLSPNDTDRRSNRKRYGPMPEGQGWAHEDEYLMACKNAHSHVYKHGIHWREAKEMRANGEIPALALKRKLDPTYRHPHTTAPEPRNSRAPPARVANALPDASQSARSSGSGVNAKTPQTLLLPSYQENIKEDDEVMEVSGLVLPRNEDGIDTQALPSTSPSAVIQLSQEAYEHARFVFDPERKASSELDKEEIRCSCNTKLKVGVVRLVQCDMCDYWQHWECHGFFLGDDRLDRIDKHLCYGCLLSANSGLFEEMVMLSKKRKYLFHLYTSLSPGAAGLVLAKFNLFQTDKDSIERCLHTEGYLREATADGSWPDRHVVRTDEQMKKLIEDYFDPMTNIAHYFVTPGSQDEGRIDQVTQPDNMYRSQFQDYPVYNTQSTQTAGAQGRGQLIDQFNPVDHRFGGVNSAISGIGGYHFPNLPIPADYANQLSNAHQAYRPGDRYPDPHDGIQRRSAVHGHIPDSAAQTQGLTGFYPSGASGSYQPRPDHIVQTQGLAGFYPSGASGSYQPRPDHIVQTQGLDGFYPSGASGSYQLRPDHTAKTHETNRLWDSFPEQLSPLHNDPEGPRRSISNPVHASQRYERSIAYESTQGSPTPDPVDTHLPGPEHYMSERNMGDSNQRFTAPSYTHGPAHHMSERNMGDSNQRFTAPSYTHGPAHHMSERNMGDSNQRFTAPSYTHGPAHHMSERNMGDSNQRFTAPRYTHGPAHHMSERNMGDSNQRFTAPSSTHSTAGEKRGREEDEDDDTSAGKRQRLSQAESPLQSDSPSKNIDIDDFSDGSMRVMR